MEDFGESVCLNALAFALSLLLMLMLLLMMEEKKPIEGGISMGLYAFFEPSVFCLRSKKYHRSHQDPVPYELQSR